MSQIPYLFLNLTTWSRNSCNHQLYPLDPFLLEGGIIGITNTWAFKRMCVPSWKKLNLESCMGNIYLYFRHVNILGSLESTLLVSYSRIQCKWRRHLPWAFQAYWRDFLQHFPTPGGNSPAWFSTLLLYEQLTHLLVYINNPYKFIFCSILQDVHGFTIGEVNNTSST